MTPAQLRVLDYVRDHIAVSGFAPSIEEICRDVGLAGKGHAHKLVEQLVSGGYLLKAPGKKRGLSLADTPDMRGIDSAVLLAELRRRGLVPGAFVEDMPRRVAGAVSCAVNSCGTPVERGHLFCREHYWAISEETRKRLFKTHRAYRNKPDPATERPYRAAFEQCIAEATGAYAGGVQ